MKMRTARHLRKPHPQRELRRLRDFLSEAYVACGALIDLDQPGAQELLDNLYAASEGQPLPHRSILPTWGVKRPEPLE